ncbi:hypothetical protein GCM10029976_080340 [Kribbella albertanoniae]
MLADGQMLKLPLSDYWKNKPYKPTDPEIIAIVAEWPLPDDRLARTLARVLNVGATENG